MHAGVPEISPTIPMAAAPCSVDRICTVIGFVDVACLRIFLRIGWEEITNPSPRSTSRS